jgi:hypothetical protein
MLRSLRPSAFVPPGFHVESAVHDGAMTVITVRHMIKTSRCLDCTAIAERIPSRYLRRLADLPLARWPRPKRYRRRRRSPIAGI